MVREVVRKKKISISEFKSVKIFSLKDGEEIIRDKSSKIIAFRL